ncbi:aldo/keto reductase [Streptomyces sp. CA-106110]|uniref:aldo/keto reductase n=1 Tax=Streptomyces sp. CA-106110 TaxID=3240044 RepID=UPI003D8F101B
MLNTDCIGLYQIHRPDPWMDIDETALRDLIRTGGASAAQSSGIRLGSAEQAFATSEHPAAYVRCDKRGSRRRQRRLAPDAGVDFVDAGRALGRGVGDAVPAGPAGDGAPAPPSRSAVSTGRAGPGQKCSHKATVWKSIRRRPTAARHPCQLGGSRRPLTSPISTRRTRTMPNTADRAPDDWRTWTC